MLLKPIKDIDDNRKIEDLPDEVFGYVGAANLLKVSGLENLINLRIRNNIEKTARKTTWYFRINKYSSENITLLGYISGQADSLINQKKDLLDMDIQVFPAPYKEYVYEKEFKLNDKNLRIRPRYIADSNIAGNAQWLVDVSKGNVNILETDGLQKNIEQSSFEKPFYIKSGFWKYTIALLISLISIPWWPVWLSYLIK